MLVGEEVGGFVHDFGGDGEGFEAADFFIVERQEADAAALLFTLDGEFGDECGFAGAVRADEDVDFAGGDDFGGGVEGDEFGEQHFECIGAGKAGAGEAGQGGGDFAEQSGGQVVVVQRVGAGLPAFALAALGASARR